MSAGQPKLWKVLAVLVAMAAGLRGFDTVLVWASGVPRGVIVCTSLRDAEARTKLDLTGITRLDDELVLLENGIRVTTRPVAAVSVRLRTRQPPTAQLSVFRSAGAPIPEALRPPLPAFHQIKVSLADGIPAELRAESFPDGTVWQDIEWTDGHGRTALRFDGHTVDLLRAARRLAEGEP
jgi:hypothetical protein